MNTRKTCDETAQERVLILDGAMGTMIQGLDLAEADFRGGRFASHTKSLWGCNDALCLTNPDVIESVHRSYLEAGADIIETCSFNATAVSLAEYGLEAWAYEISAAAARIARNAADAFSTPDAPRFVAGSMGPTAKSAGIAPDMYDLSKRSVTFDELAAAYYDNARGLLDGGADLLLIETVFDIINAKAAVFAVNRLKEERRCHIPLMISATIANDAGHILSGQSLAAFCAAVCHGNPWALGLNCSFGAAALEPHVRELAGLAPCLVIAYPNAGLPNRQGAYDETPQTMAAHLERYLRQGLVNILGGCCGSTPAHIAAVAELARGFPPRKLPGRAPAALGNFRTDRRPPESVILIGDRTNGAKNQEFARLIAGEDYDEGVSIAQDMLESGAGGITVCMDGVLPDASRAITRFLNLGLCYPLFARALIIIESSDWDTVEAGLKCLPGKGLARSLSLNEGAGEFLRKARQARRYGAAVAAALDDEQGAPAGYQGQIARAERAYALLTGGGIPPEAIVFDCAALPKPGLGRESYDGGFHHDRDDFARFRERIGKTCPLAAVLANVSDFLPESPAGSGVTLAIVNPAAAVWPRKGVSPPPPTH
ncbi:MAG: homocysteine S-methyltransferase family protein [Treponema sp.]|jgi:5-methyltetrahydrofolate--homocysteine methyltransferase|nr:homocysteine S-methyltransferase family protein [Treponema sp.]